jgi:hypothetical protein
MWGRAPWPLGHSVRPAGHRKGAETRAVSSGCADPRPCLVCFSSRLQGAAGPRVGGFSTAPMRERMQEVPIDR